MVDRMLKVLSIRQLSVSRNRDSMNTLLKKSKVYGTTNYYVPWDDMKKGDRLEMVREPNNKYDANAIALYFDDRTKIGYISKSLAVKFAEHMDAGVKLFAVILEITGGKGMSSPIYHGCNIAIMLDEGDERPTFSDTVDISDCEFVEE